MALTIARVAGADYTEANKRVRVRDVTFDSSYPTDGESLTAADVGLRKIEQAIPHGVAVNTAATSAVAVHYDRTNSKLLAFETGDTVSTVLDEVGNTESLDTYSVRMTFIGY
mgnify:CR=1 FL=1